MALGSNQPPREKKYQGYFLKRKGGDAKGRQLCNLHVPTVSKSSEPQIPGALRAYLGLYRVTYKPEDTPAAASHNTK
jgi:hypothetical protein